MYIYVLNLWVLLKEMNFLFTICYFYFKLFIVTVQYHYRFRANECVSFKLVLRIVHGLRTVIVSHWCSKASQDLQNS